MAGRYTKEDCILLLREKSDQLAAGNASRFPQRSDFDEEQVVAIKSFLGPWPRALEAAGLKPPRTDTRARRTKEKRIQQKQRRADRRQEENSNDEE